MARTRRPWCRTEWTRRADSAHLADCRTSASARTAEDCGALRRATHSAAVSLAAALAFDNLRRTAAAHAPAVIQAAAAASADSDSARRLPVLYSGLRVLRRYCRARMARCWSASVQLRASVLVDRDPTAARAAAAARPSCRCAAAR